MPARTRRRAVRTVPTAAALLLVGALAACGAETTGSRAASSSPTSASPTATASGGPKTSTPSSTAQAEDDTPTIAITVTGSKVTPAPHRVKLGVGDRLRLVVTSDHDDTVHAHGFDVEQDVTAGQPATLELVGAEPGLYDVELHHPELTILQVQVG